MNRILFIAVNYRSNDDALRLAESIDRLPCRDRIDLLVVDNSEPSDRQHELYRRERTGFGPDAQERSTRSSYARADGGFAIVGDGRNRGYFGGASHGLSAYKAAIGELPEWVIVGNCDLEPSGNDLVAGLDALAPVCVQENIGVLAPAIRSARSGSDQNPFYPDAPSARRYLGLSLLFRSYPLAIGYRLLAHGKRRLDKRRPPADTAQGSPGIGTAAGGDTTVAGPAARDIFAGHGSCMLFHRRFFEAGGTLDYEPFLYCEEVHIGAQARSLGIRVRYEPSLAFNHREHGTIKLFPSKEVVAHLADAHYYAYRNYLRGDNVAGASPVSGARVVARPVS